ncbi:MAG: hypothetical protein ACPGXK_13030 [Phycisphaerae bacterium]
MQSGKPLPRYHFEENAADAERHARGHLGLPVWCQVSNRPTLSDEMRGRCLNPSELPGATLVKRGDEREVWAVTCEDLRLHIKLFLGHHGGIPKPAIMESQRLLEAANRDVPVVPLMALAYDDGDRAALATLSIPNAITLAEWWEEYAGSKMHGNVASRRTVMQCVAATIAKAHMAGLYLPDGHPGNYLLGKTNDEIESPNTGTKDERYRCYLVDLAGATTTKDHSPVARSQRMRSLAQLEQYFHRKLDAKLRMVFLRAYWRAFATLNSQPDNSENNSLVDWSSAISQVQKQLATKLAGHWDRRLRKNGKYFARVELDKGWYGQFVLVVERRHRFRDRSPDRTRQDWESICRAIPLNASATARATNTEMLLTEHLLAYGIHKAENAIQALDWTLRGSPARRRFIHGHHRRHRDQDNDLMLGWLERRHRGLVRECIWFVEASQREGKQS